MQVTKTCCLIASVSRFLPARLFSDCFHAAPSLQDSCFLSATAAVRVLHFYPPSGPPVSVQHHSPLVSMSYQFTVDNVLFLSLQTSSSLSLGWGEAKDAFVKATIPLHVSAWMKPVEANVVNLASFDPGDSLQTKTKATSTFLLFKSGFPLELLSMSYMVVSVVLKLFNS